MGVDLLLLPINPYLTSEAKPSSMVVLELGRSRKLWEAINKLPSHQLKAPLLTPLGVVDDDDMEYQKSWDARRLSNDAYSEPLRWVAAMDLLPLKNHEGLYEFIENRAAWAYLAELPPETKVVLYWC